MEQRKESNIPDYLSDLLQPTPSGVAKLIAAWDGLSGESQIQILKLQNNLAPNYLWQKVLIKALDSAVPYIRYLAVKRLDLSPDENAEKTALKKRIEEDPDVLVRFSGLEDSNTLFDYYSRGNMSWFFELPHEARLACVRSLATDGEMVAKLISHAVDNQLKTGAVTKEELCEIISDYVVKPRFKEYYDRPDEMSYYGVHTKQEDLESLWELVLKLPESASRILIEHLPESAELFTSIPANVLEGLNDGQLERLFFRADIKLKELRKKIFWEADGSRKYLREAAVSHNFDLSHSEFALILSKPLEERIRYIDLAAAAQDLSLCINKAIRDVFSALKGDTWKNLEYPFGNRVYYIFEDRLQRLQGYEREVELRELRLYMLASAHVLWDSADASSRPSGKLAFLGDKIVDGDTWATFMAFVKSWPDGRRGKQLERYLPRIEELDEMDSDWEEPDNDG